MKRQATRRRLSRGQVIVLAPFMLLVAGGLVSLTADVGMLFVEGARLQNAADAAVLAALAELVGERAEGQDEEGAREAALAEAQTIKYFNYTAPGITIEFGTRDGDGTFVPADEGTEATAVRAAVCRDETAPGGELALSFARLLGVGSAEVSAGAVASLSGNIRGVTGLSPFAIHQDSLAEPGEEMTFYPGGDGNGNGNDNGNGNGNGNANGNGNGDDQTAPGNWGLLNLDGGSLGTPELREWILYGYDGEIIIGEEGYVWIDGTTGWRATLESTINERIGEPMVFIIYDQVTGNGSNADYRCIGFLVATVTSCQLTGNNRHATCRVEEVTMVHNVLTGGSYTSPNMRKLQLVE